MKNKLFSLTILMALAQGITAAPVRPGVPPVQNPAKKASAKETLARIEKICKEFAKGKIGSPEEALNKIKHILENTALASSSESDSQVAKPGPQVGVQSLQAPKKSTTKKSAKGSSPKPMQTSQKDILGTLEHVLGFGDKSPASYAGGQLMGTEATDMTGELLAG